jgi:NAD(P)-dependent dehydrogenase (short-subunit alcohol dehydrogenase family)
MNISPIGLWLFVVIFFAIPHFKGEKEMTRLAGRVAIVTGAGRGIGVSYAKRYAEEGAKVVCVDVLDSQSTVDTIKQAGGNAIGVKADVTDAKAVAEMARVAVETYGKIDILLNNAALFANLERRHFMDIPSEEWDKVMQINTRGVFECIRAVVPDMRKREYGKIINIASGTVFKGTTGLCQYVASKGAVVAMTRVIARELGPDNICVNALAPGMTLSEALAERDFYLNSSTPSTRAFKRHEYPEDLTGAAVFLASADSDFMTGQCMVVDGGAAMH